MSVKRIIEAFNDWRGRGEPIVLATVYQTLGSTYSKPGHRILIAADGSYQGLVSGGCLEGDLAERALAVLESDAAEPVTYDMRDDADDIWGLGIGCNGLIRVFLQPLEPATGYEPFATIAECSLANDLAAVATVIESGGSDLVRGATLVTTGAGSVPFGLDAAAARRLHGGSVETLESGATRYRVEADRAGILYALLRPVPRLLVLGAGLDAVPLVDIAARLGWPVTVADHRPAYLERGDFGAAERILALDPRALADAVTLDRYDAVVVMSHHLVTDRIYLEQLVEAPAVYVGVLGPPARKRRLLDALGERGAELESRLKGPVGLDIGADSPELIALSIVAEMQATFAGSPRTS
jgi:xanthine dehydrogenase accessory factor